MRIRVVIMRMEVIMRIKVMINGDGDDDECLEVGGDGRQVKV